MSIKNVTSDFITQLYAPVLEKVEHRVDKEHNVRFFNSVFTIVEHSVDKGNIGFCNLVLGGKSLNKADPLSAYQQILAT